MGVPRRIGDIQVYAEIGQGPLSIVCRGYDRKRDRFVLLKILRREAMLDEGIIERFDEEARLAARIEHENVVAVYGFGREGEQAYIATEFVDGTDLASLVTLGRIPEMLAVFILFQIARGLEAAHEERVLHRDLKPSNVMVGNDGSVKLTDFGFASLIGEPQDEIRGTASYLTPEQLRGESFTPESDLFALGAVFFEMLLGRPAFMGGSTSEIVDSILNDDPVEALEHLPGISRESRLLCRKLMAKQPSDRVQSAAQAVAELENIADSGTTAETLQAYLLSPEEYRHDVGAHEREKTEQASREIRARSAPRAEAGEVRPRKTNRRRRLSAATAVAAIVIVAAGLNYLVWSPTSPSNPSSGLESENLPVSGPPTAVEPTGTARDDDVLAPGMGRDDASVSERAADSVAASDLNRPDISENKSIDGEEANLAVADPSESGALSIDSTRTGAVPDDTTDANGTPADSAPVPGRLSVDSVPWAVLYIDDDSVSTTPLRAPLAVAPGEHLIALRNPEFPEYRQQISISPGQAVDISVSLYSLVGQVLFEISPWAEVSIDGAVRDTIPPQEHPLLLAGGEYALRLRHPSLGVWETSLLVVSGETRRLRFNLFELLSQ